MFSFFKKKKIVAHLKLSGVIGNVGKFKQGIDFAGQEELIKKAINKFSYSKTCIIIAHRLSTIKNANRIIFLKNGKIMEDGDHEKLLSAKGYYSDLYNKQWMDYFK